MASPLLDEKILAIEQAFSKTRIPHAFGGALALAYYGTPRGTVDIDINIFLRADEADAVFQALSDLGVDVTGKREHSRLKREGQIRVRWEHTPVDLFFSYDALHESCAERATLMPFGDGVIIPVLSAEDLVIFKVLFDRPKDRSDIREVLFALGPRFDRAYCLDWLARILEPKDERLLGFRAAMG